MWKMVLNTNPIDCNGLSTINGNDVIWMDEPKMFAKRNRNKPMCHNDRLYDGGCTWLEFEFCDTMWDFRWRISPTDWQAEDTTAAVHPTAMLLLDFWVRADRLLSEPIAGMMS